jgi:hypothetical protein
MRHSPRSHHRELPVRFQPNRIMTAAMRRCSASRGRSRAVQRMPAGARRKVQWSARNAPRCALARRRFTMTPERPIPAPTRSIAFEREQSARACGSPSSALGRRDEPPIVRIGKAGQKRLRQRECLEFWVVIELRPAAPGRFNNNIDVPRLR